MKRIKLLAVRRRSKLTAPFIRACLFTTVGQYTHTHCFSESDFPACQFVGFVGLIQDGSRVLKGGWERKDSLIRYRGLRSEDGGILVDLGWGWDGNMEAWNPSLPLPPVSFVVAEADAAIVGRLARQGLKRARAGERRETPSVCDLMHLPCSTQGETARKGLRRWQVPLTREGGTRTV